MPDPADIPEETGEPTAQVPPVPGPAPTPPTAEDLRKALALAEAAFNDAKAKLAAQDARDAVLRQVDAVRDAYAADKAKLAQAQAELEAFAGHERACLDQIVPDAKTKVPAIAKREADDRAVLELAVAEVNGDLAKAEADLVAAKAAYDERKATLAALGTLASGVRTRQARAAAVKTAIQQAAADGDYALAYWLLVEQFVPLVIGEPKLLSADALHSAILAATQALADAEATIGAKTAEVAAAKAMVAAAQATIAAFDKGRQARIDEALDTITPVPPGGGNS